MDEEISIGDFVLTGGEIPAMAVADAVCRMVPGVLPDEEAFTAESHWDGLLERNNFYLDEEKEENEHVCRITGGVRRGVHGGEHGTGDLAAEGGREQV